jgi:plasmid stabilization system protein ParE
MEQMTLLVTLHSEAEAELAEAYDWFETHWESGDEFVSAVRGVLRRIAANADMHSVVTRNVRRAVVTGYRYYDVYYRERETDIEVISIFHTSQNPKLWQDRI